MSIQVRSTLHPLKAWLSDVVGGSGHRTQFRRGLELELQVDGELRGLGEASPLPHFSTEHLEDVATELARIGTFQAELPKAPPESRAFIEDLVQHADCRIASARFAFEGALVDLCSRHFGLPAADLMAKMTTQRQPGTELEVSKLLSGTELPILLSQARRAWARGYRTIKIKLRSVEDFAEDYDNLAALRRQLEPTLKLRLDPNQSWPISDLPRLLDRLSALSPELVEEPVAASQLIELDTSPVSLALDESMRTDGLLDTLAPHLGRLDICAIVLKPALLGLLRAIDLAEQARRLGLDVIVTHLFDGPVGHATAASLALAVGTETRAHGLAPHPGLLLRPERRIQGLGAGRLKAVSQPGLPLSEVARC